jgi:hypothetical protein
MNEIYYTVLKKDDLKIAEESIKKANIAEVNYLDSKIQRIDKDLQNFNYKYEKLVD